MKVNILQRGKKIAMRGREQGKGLSPPQPSMNSFQTKAQALSVTQKEGAEQLSPLGTQAAWAPLSSALQDTAPSKAHCLGQSADSLMCRCTFTGCIHSGAQACAGTTGTCYHSQWLQDRFMPAKGVHPADVSSYHWAKQGQASLAPRLLSSVSAASHPQAANRGHGEHSSLVHQELKLNPCLRESQRPERQGSVPTRQTQACLARLDTPSWTPEKAG